MATEQIEKTWAWLSWVPLAILVVPFLVVGGPAIQSELMGPTNIWNTTKRAPPDADLIGYYQLAETDSESPTQEDTLA